MVFLATSSKNSVSFRLANVKLRPNEEVIGLELEVLDGGFEGMSSLPKGWHLNVDNRSASHTKVTADLEFGTERMSAKDMDGVTLSVTEFDGKAARLSGHLVVTNTASERHHSLGTSNFLRQ